MANDAAKESMDEIVRAIGFGIVSDFRSLYDAMRDMSSTQREANSILDNVNRNATGINKALDDFQEQKRRSAEARAAKRAEDKLEGRVSTNAQRNEESMRQMQKTLDAILQEIKLGSRDAGGEEGGGVGDAIGAAAGAAVGGSFLKGAARVAAKAGVVGLAVAGVAAVGAAGAYMMSGGSSTGEDSGASVGPSTGPAGSGSVPTPASDLAKMGGAAVGGGAAAGAAALISRSTMSAKQKALAKISAKVPSYLSKFGGRISTVIGMKSIPIFGALVGGYFSFSRFMSGDSWTAIGAEFVSGVLPDVTALGGPAGYVAGVASTLAIQTYLICRDIYQEENAIDIKNNVVPNFDDLDMSERIQVLNAVKGYVESYVNNLLGRSKPTDATTGVTPSATSGAPSDTTPPAPAAAPPVAPMGPSGQQNDPDAGAPRETNDSVPTSGGITTQAAQDIAQNRAITPPGQIPETTAQQTAFTQNVFGPSQSGAAQTGGGLPNVGQMPGASPSDTIATFNTQSDQSSMYAGGEYGSILNYIADSEGSDYNTQFGYQNTTDGRPLTEMTVKEVMEAQAKQKGSSAIGRYQFMKQTMIDGINAGVINPDETFSPETQDRFATWLIDSKRNGSKWRAGKMSNQEFGKALSQEWASVPNPYTGASYYGQGIKHDTGTLMSVIESAKGPPPTAMAEGGKITPLTSDAPKAGRDLSAELQPPKSTSEIEDDDELSSSARTIDARQRATSSGSPKEKKKNMISSYMPYMSYLFGAMTSEMNSYMNGEVTADRAFQDAMNPLS